MWLIEIVLGIVGVTAIPLIIIKYRGGNKTKQKQRSGKNSVNIQVGKDFKVNKNINHE
jgi:hypothetical protein